MPVLVVELQRDNALCRLPNDVGNVGESKKLDEK